jgi:1-acyl-sn-glycerol-3-phosphate acyltransferase
MPVIPVAMIGTDRILPPGRVVRLHQVSWVGKAAFLRAYQGTAPGRARPRHHRRSHPAIQDLSGQEYVPIYASVRKAK